MHESPTGRIRVTTGYFRVGRKAKFTILVEILHSRPKLSFSQIAPLPSDRIPTRFDRLVDGEFIQLIILENVVPTDIY